MAGIDGNDFAITANPACSARNEEALVVEFEIVLVKAVNTTQINFAPIFETPLEVHHTVEVYERDLVVGNSTNYRYFSPKAVDHENNTINITVDNYDNWPFLTYEIYNNDSFKFEIDRS